MRQTIGVARDKGRYFSKLTSYVTRHGYVASNSYSVSHRNSRRLDAFRAFSDTKLYGSLLTRLHKHAWATYRIDLVVQWSITARL